MKSFGYEYSKFLGKDEDMSLVERGYIDMGRAESVR
jgi:hypothetical protein